MGLKRIYERIPLDGLGYPGGWAEVCVNPSRKEMETYADASIAISPKPLKDEELAGLSGTELLEVIERNRPSEEVETQFIRSRLAVLGKVYIDGQTWDLSTEEGYKTFAEEGDAQITLLMQDEFLRRRNERLKQVSDSFRSKNGAGAAQGQVRPEVGAAT